MPQLQHLSVEDRRRFRSGRRSIDLAHTGGEGPAARWELLHEPGDLARWLAVIIDTGPVEASAGDLDAARRLRSAIWRSAHRSIAGHAPTAGDRRTINAAARPAPPIPSLAADGVRWEVPVPASAALSLIARDAIDLFGGPLAARVRECESPTCGLLFVDQSRPGTRKWCSMERCGNLAKVRAHRRRGEA